MIIREHINFERGMDPKESMDIGLFKFDVEYDGDEEHIFNSDKEIAKTWRYKGKAPLKFEGTAGDEYVSMNIEFSDGDALQFDLYREVGPVTPQGKDYAVISIESLGIQELDVQDRYDEYSSEGTVIGAILNIYRDLIDPPYKVVKESLDFERGIDPKASMKIGMPTWETLQEGDIIYVPKRVGIKNDNVISELHAVADLPAGNILVVRELDNASTKEWTLRYIYFSNMRDYKENEIEKDRFGYITGTPKQFREKFKLLPRNVNEVQNFERGVDPKSTMNIGKRSMIETWLKEYDLFEDAVINKDLTIDIPAKANLAVHLNKKGLENFPEYIQFRRTYGGFDISDNKFTSLRGCPTHVFETDNLKGSFKCFDNNLSSLEGGPKRVDGVYICYGNPGKFQRKDVNAVCRVKSKQIWGDDRMKVNEAMDFQRREDPLGSMDLGFHAQVKNWFKSCGISDDPTEMEHYVEYRINKDGTIDVLEDINLVEAHIENFPYFIKFNKIYGGFYVANNIFTSLEGFPKEVDGDLSIYSNQPGAKKWKESDLRKRIKVKGNIWN
jgi:hypothetical protein